MKKFWGKSEVLYRNCKKTREICKMFGEVSKNFENITRNFEENFEEIFWKWGNKNIEPIGPIFHELYPFYEWSHQLVAIFLVEFKFLHDFFINDTKKWEILIYLH